MLVHISSILYYSPMKALDEDLHRSDEVDKLKEYLVHLARLALAERRQDVQAYVARVARHIRKEMPAAADELGSLLREGSSLQAPIRGSEVAMMPVDSESRLSLARVETSPTLETSPIWDDLTKRTLDNIIIERRRFDDLLRAGIHPTCTALFVGAPGVGKTMAARWIAQELHWPLIVLDLAAVMSSFLGRTGLNLRNVLDYAKGTPCVLLLDEIDAIAKRRDDNSDIGELKRLVNVLIQGLDDWPETSLLIAATNHADLLDSAIWRRFEIVLRFPMPSREQIRRLIVSRLQSDINVHIASALAAAFENLSFSDVERKMLTIRRRSILDSTSINDLAIEEIRCLINEQPRSKRRLIGQDLVDAGISQRMVHRITGIARDTIRKASKENAR